MNCTLFLQIQKVFSVINSEVFGELLHFTVLYRVDSRHSSVCDITGDYRRIFAFAINGFEFNPQELISTCSMLPYCL